MYDFRPIITVWCEYRPYSHLYPHQILEWSKDQNSFVSNKNGTLFDFPSELRALRFATRLLRKIPPHFHKTGHIIIKLSYEAGEPSSYYPHQLIIALKKIQEAKHGQLVSTGTEG